MNTELIKTLGMLVICTVISMLLKALAPSIAPILSAVVTCSVIGVCLVQLFPVTEFFLQISQSTPFGSYIGILMKVCGIGVITKLCSDTCRDCGENAYATKAELVGKTAIILIIMPVIKTLFEQVKDFLT